MLATTIPTGRLERHTTRKAIQALERNGKIRKRRAVSIFTPNTALTKEEECKVRNDGERVSPRLRKARSRLGEKGKFDERVTNRIL